MTTKTFYSAVFADVSPEESITALADAIEEDAMDLESEKADMVAQLTSNTGIEAFRVVKITIEVSDEVETIARD